MRIVFLGTPDFGIPALKRLQKEGHEILCVVTQPDRPQGRKMVLTPCAMKQAAQEAGLPVFSPEKINSEDSLAYLSSLAPDVMVTAAYGQILIGTQMITKGLDFERVTMVGVVAADLSLFHGDGLGTERIFQLICQVCGRAGRGELPGTAVVQTYVPGHYAIRCAARNEYEAFYRREMQERQNRLLPPFVRVMRMVLSSEDEDSVLKDLAFYRSEAEKALTEVPKRYAQEIQDSLILLEGMKAPAERIRGLYCYQLLCRAKEGRGADILEKMLSRLENTTAPAGSHAALEINPNTMI